ncbi:hypothetical protein CDAR_199601 [Caerostris darwini]|uniref:Uncharacterized protein n=1 Tax=Caerostris darwini TaxID=1538125 RepID=A0AAV4M8H5_9ARAC|nr:hypothetical protein CDAR_199601 [Caerostris darwini]
MVNNRMLGLELVVIVIFTNSYVTARPAPDKYDGIPSGVLHPISGVVPISAHKQHPHSLYKMESEKREMESQKR